MSETSYRVPREGSLGLLALGAHGLTAWREARDKKPAKNIHNGKGGGSKKVLVIGWDAADWKIIQPLMDQGKMPALKRFIEEGVSGNISTLDPPLSPMLWTSIGTGMFADKHGILGFVEPDPDTQTVRPVTTTSRKVRAIWNILTQQNHKTHLVSWWPSYPAEPINGICLSNHYQRANQPIDKPWPLTAGTVFPPQMTDLFKELRIHPDELTEAHILPFIPDAAKIDQEKDHRLGSLSKILADCATVQSAATWIMENTEWDFMGVYFDAIDHFCHGFMKFHPPKLPHITDEDFGIYQHVIEGAYIFHDMMLERLLNLCNEDTHVILLSDHGFKSDHLRPLSVPDEPAGPALEHRQLGVLCMKGPMFRKNERIFGSSLLDITPTILSLFNLPVGKDMDGYPLVQAFEKAPEIKEIESWEKVKGNFGTHSESYRQDPFLAQQAIEQLVELGYVEDTGDDKTNSLKKAEHEWQYNLARVYTSSDRPHLAIPIYEKLFEECKELRFGFRLISCYRLIGQVEKSRNLFDEIKKLKKNYNPGFDLLEASQLIDEGKQHEALELLKKTSERDMLNPDLHIMAGRCFLTLEAWTNAETAFKNALRLDPESAGAHQGLGLSLLRREMYEEAAESLLNATGIIYQFPIAHFYLGESLYHLGEFAQAAQCFQLVLAMNPGMVQAKEWLEKVVSQHPEIQLHQDSRSKEDALHYDGKDRSPADLVKPFRAKVKGEMVIVSGLPRSGTSMMMRMLDAGGLDIFTDKERTADESNPKGYFEHEAIKNTARDKRWLKQAVGKTAKVVAPLLHLLPPVYRYKIIFMRRNMSEIISSQHQMLVRNKKAKADSYPTGLEISFQKILDKAEHWAKTGLTSDVLFIDYAEVIENPEAIAEKIESFLEKPLDKAAMVKAVDRSLYRTKKEISE